jgi:hypothetical protein
MGPPDRYMPRDAIVARFEHYAATPAADPV